jgi:hypothetical protein
MNKRVAIVVLVLLVVFLAAFVLKKNSEITGLKTENATLKLAIRQAAELRLVKDGKIGMLDDGTNGRAFCLYVTYFVPRTTMGSQVVLTFEVEGNKLRREVFLVGDHDGGKYEYDGEEEIFRIVNRIK